MTNAGIGLCQIVISAVNWGEVVYTLGKRNRTAPIEQIQGNLAFLSTVRIVAVTAERAARAAAIKLRYAIPFADCFAVELASDSPDHILISADFDMLPAPQDIRIALLPVKSPV